MRISILIPHFRTWKMTFYAIHQLLKCSGRHQQDIYVVDNNPEDGTAEKLKFFGEKINVLPYPSHLLQSHGIGYDFLVPHLRTEVFATIESDSFPTKESGEWLDWVELLVKEGYDSAGSCLDLSGGQFVHTAGAFYKKSIWQKAKRYVDEVEYSYLPNIAMKDGFPCHLMVHKSVHDQFALGARDLIQLAPEYDKWGTAELASVILDKIEEYRPIGRGVFHNGIGNTDEAFGTYHERNVVTERDHILQDNKKPLIWRMGSEPGQFFCYWMLANKHKIYAIPTETKWMPNRENQQQERTVMENGFTHCWAITAYNDATNPELKDIIDYKKNMMEELYNSIPANERI
jgi:hypothetical protein